MWYQLFLISPLWYSYKKVSLHPFTQIYLVFRKVALLTAGALSHIYLVHINITGTVLIYIGIQKKRNFIVWKDVLGKYWLYRRKCNKGISLCAEG